MIMIGKRMNNREYTNTTNLNYKIFGIGALIYIILLTVPSTIYNYDEDTHPANYRKHYFKAYQLPFIIIAVILTFGSILYICINIGKA